MEQDAGVHHVPYRAAPQDAGPALKAASALRAGRQPLPTSHVMR